MVQTLDCIHSEHDEESQALLHHSPCSVQPALTALCGLFFRCSDHDMHDKFSHVVKSTYISDLPKLDKRNDLPILSNSDIRRLAMSYTLRKLSIRICPPLVFLSYSSETCLSENFCPRATFANSFGYAAFVTETYATSLGSLSPFCQLREGDRGVLPN